MNALATYNRLFSEVLLQPQEKLPDLKYQDIPEWDSVGHMSLISAIEEAFNIMLDTEDIIDFSSWREGRVILQKYGVDIA